MNKELAKTLTIALVNYIDENRPEGTMDCSNVACAALEKTFVDNDFKSVEDFIQYKLSRLTEFEKCMLDFAEARNEYEFDSTKVVEINNKVIELTKSYSKKLLDIAREQFIKDGYVIEKKSFHDAVEKISPEVMKEVSDEVDEMLEKEQKPEEKPINWTELTWKDIVELEGIINNVHYEFRNGIGQESFGKEVLERFRSTKGVEYLDEAEQKYWQEDEQKPAHTAKEMWKEMRLEVYAQASGNRHEPNYADASTKMFSLCDIDEIFDEIGDYIAEAQSTKWSGLTDKDTAVQTLKEVISLLKERNLWPGWQSSLTALAKDIESLQIVKPAKWSEEDRKMLLSIINAFRNGTVSTIGQEQWLKSLPKRFNLQPKPAWSEEDKKMFSLVRLAIWDDEKKFNPQEMRIVLRWLKSLRPQPKEEWSENDEKMLDELLDHCNTENATWYNWLKSLRPSWKPSAQELGALKTAVSVLTKERTFPKAAEQIQKIIDVFDGKELRKDWKPSEEQMEALKDAVRLFKDTHFEKFHYKIESLYEQLEKLM